MTKRQLIEEALSLVEVFNEFDDKADDADQTHIESVAALQAANDKAAEDNLLAEQVLLSEEANAASAYDQALQAAKLKREQARRAADQLVMDARVDEETKNALKIEARDKVGEVFESITKKLLEARDYVEVAIPPAPEPEPVPVPEPTPVPA